MYLSSLWKFLSYWDVCWQCHVLALFLLHTKGQCPKIWFIWHKSNEDNVNNKERPCFSYLTKVACLKLCYFPSEPLRLFCPKQPAPSGCFPISSSASVLISQQLFNPCQQRKPANERRSSWPRYPTIQSITRWSGMHKIQRRKQSMSPSCLPSRERWRKTKRLSPCYFHSHSAGRQKNCI